MLKIWHPSVESAWVFKLEEHQKCSKCNSLTATSAGCLKDQTVPVQNKMADMASPFEYGMWTDILKDSCCDKVSL